jgi:hypothetical protein
VDHHRDPARRIVEALLQAQAQILEAVECALRARVVVALVTRDEAE